MREVAEFISPSRMAKQLLRYHRDVSTVRSMVLYQFGRCPSLDILKAMRAEIDRAEARSRHRARATSYDRYAMRFGNEDHVQAMTKGSLKLAEKIKEARGHP